MLKAAYGSPNGARTVLYAIGNEYEVEPHGQPENDETGIPMALALDFIKDGQAVEVKPKVEAARPPTGRAPGPKETK